jgi:hypothetical protein
MTGTVLRVGVGRGFVVGWFVVTAAHCLPHLPRCGTIIGYDERTYQTFLGRLGEQNAVWAELLFADPISDLAILGEPEGQDLSEHAKAYCQFLSDLPGFTVADVEANTSVPAKVLSLGGEWISCRVTHQDGPLWIEVDQVTEDGMSGSPIIDDAGRAIGVVCSGNGVAGQSGSSVQCRLMHSLPRWFEAQAVE